MFSTFRRTALAALGAFAMLIGVLTVAAPAQAAPSTARPTTTSTASTSTAAARTNDWWW